jgi:lipopolysaccharide transport system ATP-binding protein
MFSDSVIRCAGIGKAYQIYPNYNDRLWQVLFGRFRTYYHDLWVLHDVDIEVARGECLGIIGRNGAGKTTLLQIICGISDPTCGAVSIRGRIAPVLALSAGFTNDLTGRENVLIGATVLGMSRAEALERLPSIAEFSGIGEFFDQPVKFYSSGMASRLAFSVCVHVDADILIIDEALAVGDAAFRVKCLDFLDDFRSRGTIVFVSHNMEQVSRLCNRVAWLDGGSIRTLGAPDAVIQEYSDALPKDRKKAEVLRLSAR